MWQRNGETKPTNNMVVASTCLHTLRTETIVDASMSSSDVWFLTEEYPLALVMLVVFEDSLSSTKAFKGVSKRVHVQLFRL